MKPFKKILGVVALSAALVAGLGVVANAATAISTPSEADLDALGEVVDDDFAEHPNWVPKVMKQQTVFLYKDSTAKDNALPWKLDPATSVIPIKNFAWNADIKNISTGTKQVTVSRNKTGQYYLNISTSQYIKPGKSVTVKFAIKQHGAWFNMKTKLVFAKAAVPFSQLAIGGDNNILAGEGSAWKYIRGLRNFDLYDWQDEDYFRNHPYPVKVKMYPGYKLDKIVVTKKDGHSYTIHNGDKVNIKKIKKIQIKYKATKELTYNKARGVGDRVYAKGFEPKESNGYAHLFDTVYVLTINIK
jgi:hypothetical protein